MSTKVDTYIPINCDDWYGVTDTKKRKKIQDRLAQRARRKRLREAQKTNTETSQTSTKQPALLPCVHEICHSFSQSASSAISIDGFDFLSTSPVSNRSPYTPQPLSDYSQRLSSTTSLLYQPSYQLTVTSALYVNGLVLGLSSCIAVPSRSLPCSADVPLSLQPTPIQLTTIHFTGIDRFPFPKVRDNLILMSTVIDEEELTRDLILAPSFTIIPGGLAWDPRAWKIERPFAEKWGFLFF